MLLLLVFSSEILKFYWLVGFKRCVRRSLTSPTISHLREIKERDSRLGVNVLSGIFLPQITLTI